MSSNSSQNISQHKGRKTLLHILPIMISVQVFFFAGVSIPYLMNEYQGFLKFIILFLVVTVTAIV